MELLDLCSLDYKIYKFLPVKVIAAIVYLMVNRWFSISNYEILPQREDLFEIFDYTENIKVLPTYHPSYIIRQGGIKSNAFDKVVEDFKKALSLI
jgi:uracil-DNA glycosylase